MPDEKLKRGARIEAGLQIARRHGQFVEIGKKAGVFTHAIWLDRPGASESESQPRYPKSATEAKVRRSERQNPQASAPCGDGRAWGFRREALRRVALTSERRL